MIDRWLTRLGFAAIRFCSRRFSPPSHFMWRYRDGWFYFDEHQQMWSVRPTGDPRNPLVITLEKR